MKLTVEHEEVKVALGALVEFDALEAKEMGAIIHRHFEKKRGRRSDAQAAIQRLGDELNGMKFK